MALDLIRQAAAGLIEVPEQSLQLTGKALEAVGEMLEGFAQRLDALEQAIGGQQNNTPA